MNINDALKYFYFLFDKGIINKTEKSIEAINVISKFVEQKNEQQFNDNQLFGKLFISFYGELLRYYNATVFDKEPQKAINKILDTPIEQLIEKFIDKATILEQSKQFEIDGVLKHPKNLSKEQRESIEILEPVMNYQEAKDNLTAMINNALNSFN